MNDYVGKDDILKDLQQRVEDKILEPSNYELLKKLVENADTLDEAIKIAELGTTYRRTGFHFDKKLEKQSNTISYFKKNKKLSFTTDPAAITHKLIIGDNYPALLNLLVEYKSGVDVIYIDPPYGKDDLGEFAQTNYENAISRDNLLSMLYPRLWLAKQLLSENGVIFCSIDDKNQAYLRGLFDEVFQELGFVANFVIDKTAQGANQSNTFKTQHEFLLCYVKNNQFLINSNLANEVNLKKFKYTDEKGRYAITNGFDSINSPLTSNKNRGYTIYFNEKTGDALIRDEYNKDSNVFGDFDQELIDKGYVPIRPGIRNQIQYPWNWKRERFLEEYKNELVFMRNKKGEMGVYHKNRSTGIIKDTTIKKFDTRKSGNAELIDILGTKLFDYPKSIEMMKWVISKFEDKSAIVLDFFAGSGTTGQAVLELNRNDKGSRQFILVTNNEITQANPNGIALDATSRRLKRVMTGEDYDGDNNFRWLENNKPLGDNLLAIDIAEVANFEASEGKTAFDLIDETLYGQEKLDVNEKVKWVAKNFEQTQKRLEEK